MYILRPVTKVLWEVTLTYSGGGLCDSALNIKVNRKSLLGGSRERAKGLWIELFLC